MKKGCVYCEAMHLNKCPDAFTEVAQHCGSYDHTEMPEVKSGKRSYKIYAVDFDGTLCVESFPEIGVPNTELIAFLREERKLGNKVILWTCRVAERLQEAVSWCKEQGLEFDTVNANIPEMIAYWGNDPRKVFADIYIDDKALINSPYCVPFKEEL